MTDLTPGPGRCSPGGMPTSPPNKVVCEYNNSKVFVGLLLLVEILKFSRSVIQQLGLVLKVLLIDLNSKMKKMLETSAIRGP